MSTPTTDVSIVIPAFNEARRLPATLAGWQRYLAQQTFSARLLVVDDGSTDATSVVAEQRGASVSRLTVNTGKGGAVRAGILAATSAVIAYADADMNVDPSHLTQALRLIDAGADLVAGRRDLSEYAAAEGMVRLVAGGLVQFTRRLLVLAAIQDTQCGFKVFRRDVAHSVFSRARIRSFAFDIEILYLARKDGARIVEMPVSTTYRAESTFSVRKHLPSLVRDIVRIRLNDWRGYYR